MMTRYALFLPACALLWVLSGCSDNSTATRKEPEKPPEPISGLSAVYRMYQVARTWAPDTQVLNMSSMHFEGVPETPGKAGVWQATFASANLGRSRVYDYAIVEQLPSLHKGVFAEQESGFSGSRGESKPFLIAAVKIDTDAAYETAKSKAVEYEKKNPGKRITFLLEKIDRFPDPAWRVIWGDSVGTSNFSVYVDASTGAYLETMH